MERQLGVSPYTHHSKFIYPKFHLPFGLLLTHRHDVHVQHICHFYNLD